MQETTPLLVQYVMVAALFCGNHRRSLSFEVDSLFKQGHHCERELCEIKIPGMIAVEKSSLLKVYQVTFQQTRLIRDENL